MRRMILVLVVAAFLVAMTATAAFAANGGGPKGAHKGGGPGGQVGVAGGSLTNPTVKGGQTTTIGAED